MPSGETVVKIAEYFGVTSDYLLGITDNPIPTNERPATPEGEQPVGAEDLATARRIASLSPERKARLHGYLDSLVGQDTP